MYDSRRSSHHSSLLANPEQPCSMVYWIDALLTWNRGRLAHRSAHRCNMPVLSRVDRTFVPVSHPGPLMIPFSLPLPHPPHLKHPLTTGRHHCKYIACTMDAGRCDSNLARKVGRHAIFCSPFARRLREREVAKQNMASLIPLSLPLPGDLVSLAMV